MAKLYLHHLRCCNQGYDVLHMKEAGAIVIVNEYQKLLGYSNMRLEMLNSGLVEDYIKSDIVLESNRALKDLLLQIEAEQKRIEKGVFKDRN